MVVEAAKYAALSQDVWLDTEVDVAEGATLEIQAAGIVDLWPQGGNYKVGPDAMPRMGTSPDSNPSGMLLGEFGEKGEGLSDRGQVQRDPVGRRPARPPDSLGSPWNNASTGDYTVKINPNAEVSAATPVPAKPNKAKDAAFRPGKKQ